MVVAQLAEELLAIPEARGTNPVISECIKWTFIYCQLYLKDKRKKKRGRKWSFEKTSDRADRSEGRQVKSEKCIDNFSQTQKCVE